MILCNMLGGHPKETTIENKSTLETKNKITRNKEH